MQWDPYSPDTMGPDWRPGVQSGLVIDAASKGIGWRLDSTATEDVEDLLVPLRCGISGTYLLEVFEAGDEPCGAVTTATFRPNGDLQNQSVRWWKSTWTEQGTYSVNVNYADDDVVTFNGVRYLALQPSGPGTGAGFKIPDVSPLYWQTLSTVGGFYQEINEGTLNTSDYLKYVGKGSGHSRYAYNIGTAAWPANRRVKSIRMTIVGKTAKNKMVLHPYVSMDGDRSDISRPFTFDTDRSTAVATLGELNPVTGLPWTQDDIAGFDGVSGFGWRPDNGLGVDYHSFQSWVEIDYMTENRVAIGDFTPTVSGALAWWAAELRAPQTGDLVWAKSALLPGTRYTVLLRRISSDGSIEVPSLDSGTSPPVGLRCYEPYIEAAGCVPEFTDDNARTALYPLLLQIDDPAVISGDGNGYARMVVQSVNSAGDLQQGLGSPASDVSAQLLRFMWVDTSTTTVDTGFSEQVRVCPPTEPLEVAVRRVSDDALMGTLETFQVDELAASPLVGSTPDGYPIHLVTRQMASPAALDNAAAYYLEFTSQENGFCDFGDSVAVRYHGVLSIDAGADDTGFGDPSYGGEVLFLTADGTDDEQGDVLATLSVMPDPPGRFVGRLENQTLTEEQTGCLVNSIDYALMTWAPTLLGGRFARYELERRMDGEDDWHLIAAPSDEDVPAWPDYTAPVGVFARYRMRAVRSGDMIPSVWTDEALLMREGAGAGEAAWMFVSNERPDLNVAYTDQEERTFEFGDAPLIQYREIYGRDYPVKIGALERGGDTFKLTLTVNGEREPADGGRAMFDPLVELGAADLSAVTVLDWHGRAWQAGLQVETGTESEPGWFHNAEVTVTQIAQQPAVVDPELTGALILRALAEWWIDTHETDVLSTTLPDLAGNNDARLVPSPTDGGPARHAFRGRVQMFSPGFEDMYLETPAVAALLTGSVLEIRWSGHVGHSEVTIGPLTANCIVHQGADQDASVAFGVFWNNTTGEITLRWSEDGTTVQSIVGQTPLTPGAQASGRRGVQFDLTTGDLRIYEQDLTEGMASYVQPLVSDAWTPVDHVAGAGATSIFASTSPIRQGASTAFTGGVGDEIDGIGCNGYGTFDRISLAADPAGPLLLDADFGAVVPDALVWEHVTGLPPLGGSGTSSAAVATFYDRAGRPWSVFNWLTGSMHISFINRDSVQVGSHSYIRVDPDDVVFDRLAGSDLWMVLGYRWTNNNVLGQTLVSHNLYDAMGVGTGWSSLKAAAAPPGPIALAADGAAAAADIAAQEPDGRPTTLGLQIDGAANTIESISGGAPSGSPASLAGLGPISVPDFPLSIGAVLDADGTTVEVFGAFEVFVAAVGRGVLTAGQWAALNDYARDADARPDDYRARLA